MGRTRAAIVLVLIAGIAAIFLWKTFEGPTPDAPSDGGGKQSSDAVPAGRGDPKPDPAVGEVWRPTLRRSPFAAGKAKGEPVRIEGRVVDEKREPVAGATVSLRVPELRAADATSGADGRYRLDVTAPEGIEPSDAGGLSAHDKEGRVGFTRLFLVAADAGAGEGPTIEMRAATTLEVRVVDESGNIGRARVIAWARPDEGVGETGVRVSEATTDPDGKAEVAGLPYDAIALLAIAPDGRRARAGTRVTGPDQPPVTIELEGPREVTLHVTAGKPVANAVGAKVEIHRGGGDPEGGGLLPYDPPLEVAPTDAEGLTRLRGLPPGDRPALRVVLADGSSHAPWVEASGDEWEVAVLGPRDAMDWKVVSGASPVPPDGAVLRIESLQRGAIDGAPECQMVGNLLRVNGLPRTTRWFCVRAPDGSAAEVSVHEGGARVPPVTFHPVRRIEVHLVEDGVGPMAGAGLLLEGAGGPVSGVVETDAAGRAVIETLLDLSHLDASPISVSLAIGYPDTLVLADLDAKALGKPMVVTVPREREATIRILVDGSPLIPPSLDWSWWDASHVKVTESPAAGTLVVRYRASPDDRGVPRLTLAAPGFKKVEASLPRTGADPKSSQDVKLERTGAIHVRVKRAKGPPLVLQLERHEPQAGGDGRPPDEREDLPGVAMSWRLLYRPAPVEAGNVITYDPVEPGLYRLRDATSGVVTPAIEVFSKGVPAEASIDLSDLVRVRGRVQLPVADEDPRYGGIRIVVSAFGVDFYDGTLPGKGVGPDGSFELWLPATREPTIRAERPPLRNETKRKAGPAVTISGPRDGVVLTLE